MKESLGAKPILFPCPVMIVGTYDRQGKPNIMNVAWGGICCSRPPCVNVSLRKATYTYDCILERKSFTVNIPSVDRIREADYAGIYSGRDENKFDELGLTPVGSELVDAPLVLEFPLNLECSLVESIELGLHTLFVGEILDVKADRRILGEDGRPRLDRLRPAMFAVDIRSYHAVGEKVGEAFSIGKKEGSGD